MSENIISKKELLKYLNDIKNCMIQESNTSSDNLLFLNNDSFYEYYKNKVCISEANNLQTYTISDILNIIENFIPLALKKKSLDVFLATCNEEDSPYILKSFLKSSKIEFLQLINYSKDDEEKWNEVCIICETLRLQYLINQHNDTDTNN